MDAVKSPAPTALPPDNASRLAIFDALHGLLGPDSSARVSIDALFDAVVPRLRVLVPREIHLAGERTYFEEKLAACLAEGVLDGPADQPGETVGLTGRQPWVRYPDGVLRPYTPGLELARERLDRDNSRLRASGFDIRRLVPSSAEDPDHPAFQSLLASMREHGFLKQFPILRHEDGIIVDGRARIRAAEMLDLEVEYLRFRSDADRGAARPRDTPLVRILLALDSNAGRLSEEIWGTVHQEVTNVTGRAWAQTASDLAVSELWRRTRPSGYSPRFTVGLLPFREGAEARVQVTEDGKVMLRSLIEAAGLSNYKTKVLEEYVPFERARSEHTGGRKALFARAEDLIDGITTMQQDRRERKLKLDPEWEVIRGWLRDNFGPSANAREEGQAPG
jgi:hypothetical protein